MNRKALFLASLFGALGIFNSALAACAPGTICNPLEANDFNGLLLQIASGVGALVASLGTIMIIVAGIMYLLSGGSPEKMGKAKTALIYAIAGIAVGLAATSIVQAIKNIIGTR